MATKKYDCPPIMIMVERDFQVTRYDPTRPAHRQYYPATVKRMIAIPLDNYMNALNRITITPEY